MSAKTRCTSNGESLYYNLNEIGDITEGKKITGFESKMLIDVINEIEGRCISIHRQCKSQYPLITPKNSKYWLTSIDQENRISLAHTIEKSNIPVLYNIPRMCDPGVTVSKNWSLRNYIESRLYLFNRVYNMGQSINKRKRDLCYPSVVFDFRPFVYSMSMNGKKIYVSQHIIPASKGKLGYIPISSITPNQPPIKSKSTLDIFKTMVLNVASSKANTGIAGNNYNVKMNSGNMEAFIKFIREYDGVEFVGNSNSNNSFFPKQNTVGMPNIPLTDDIIRVFFYDLIHDNVTKGIKFKYFKQLFTKEFSEFNKSVTFNIHVGAAKAAKSFSNYRSVLSMKNEVKTAFKGRGNKRKEVDIPQYPAMFKTIGDLSQFIYAGKYNTIVASGDRMGIAPGLYVNAKMNVAVKTMIEDGITGFVVYTGKSDVKFQSRSSCVDIKGSACMLNSSVKISKERFEEESKKYLPQNIRDGVNRIERTKPKLPRGFKSLAQLVNKNSYKSLTPTTKANLKKKLIEFADYLPDEVDRYMNIISPENRGKLAAATGRGLTTRAGVKRGRNNNAPIPPKRTKTNKQVTWANSVKNNLSPKQNVSGRNTPGAKTAANLLNLANKSKSAKTAKTANTAKTAKTAKTPGAQTVASLMRVAQTRSRSAV
jgi:hypothetical protein